MNVYKSKRWFCFSIVFILIFSLSCSNDGKFKLIKKYYPNGKIKSYGYYTKDTVPVDTIYSLYENGNFASKEVYDSFGHPRGQSIFFHKNGKVSKIVNYDKGITQGFYYEFNQLGMLKSKIFFIDDNQVGDSYYYNDTGHITAYNFYDFLGNNLNFISFDSNGKNIKNIRQRIFIDSVLAYNGDTDKKDEHSYDIRLVISNPPKCKNSLNIQYISKKQFLIRSDSITPEPLFYRRQKLNDSTASIKINGSQYDSMTQKTIYQTSEILLKY